MTRLPPGFRFSPTDVELILYYLKRKIMGKKLLFEAISELNIYKFSPWDLPDQCCYKSKDVEWYFFCPRERKYASGARMNRATETGYWKATGRDRSVVYDEKTVGSVKTLVFHLGTAPRGKRTDWVIHEYRFEDKDLADTGVPLDAYVLCKVFQKSGPGPKNGAQYGAPLKEEDWEDETLAEHNPSSFPSLPVFPENQSCSMVVEPESASGCPFSELHPTSTQPLICEMPVEPDSSDISPIPALHGNLSCSVATATVDPGNKSLSPLAESGPSSAKLCNQEMPLDEEDEIFHLLDNFTEDPAMLSAGNENNLCLNNLNRGRNVEAEPFIDGNDMYNGLGNLDNYADLAQTTFDISITQGAGNSHNPLFLQDVPYLELDDLEIPLSHSAETIETAGVMMDNAYTPHDSDFDMRQFCFGGNSLTSNQHVAGQNQLPALPEHYNQHVIHSDLVNYNVTNANQGYTAAYTSGISFYKQPEDRRYTAQNQERGEQQRKYFSSMHAHAASKSLYLGFSIHVKAEVILWVDGCTNDALSAVFGDSSSVLACQLAVDKADKKVCDCCYDFVTAFCFGIGLAFKFFYARFVAQFLSGVYFSNSTVLLRKFQIISQLFDLLVLISS